MGKTQFALQKCTGETVWLHSLLLFYDVNINFSQPKAEMMTGKQN